MQWDTISPVQQSEPLIYEGFTGAMASYIATADPNTHKLTPDNVPGVPSVETETEWVITSDGFEKVDIEMLRVRCAFWKANGKDVPL